MMMDGPDALSAALRAVSFALLLNAAGIPFFIAAFGHLVPNSLSDVRKLGSRLAIAALVFVAAHQALEAARMAGEMSGITDPAMQKMALLSPAGATFAARILGLILVVAGLRPTPSPAAANSASAPCATPAMGARHPAVPHPAPTVSRRQRSIRRQRVACNAVPPPTCSRQPHPRKRNSAARRPDGHHVLHPDRPHHHQHHTAPPRRPWSLCTCWSSPFGWAPFGRYTWPPKKSSQPPRAISSSDSQ